MRLVYWVLAAQGVATLAAALIGAIGWGLHGGISAGLGGLICWLPTAWFAWRAFRLRDSQDAPRILGNFQMAEIGKMLLTMVLFALVFARYENVSAPALFVAFAGVQLMFWLVPPLEARTRTPGATMQDNEISS